MILYPQKTDKVSVITIGGNIALLAQMPGEDAPRFIQVSVSSLTPRGLMFVSLFDGVPNIDPALEGEADMGAAIEVDLCDKMISVSARYAWPVEDSALEEWLDRMQESMSHF